MTERDLFVAADPSRVAGWCRARLEPGTFYVAPSAAARNAARRAFLGEKGVGVGARVVSGAALVDALEARAGLPKLATLEGVLSRLLLVEAGRRAGVPLFEAAPPSGAVAALGRLVRSLRLNGVSSDAYRDAGGDPRAAVAFASYEARRLALGVADEADRLERITAAMPDLGGVVLEDPVVSSRAQAEFYRALAGKAARLAVGVPLLAPEAVGGPAGPACAARAFFAELGLAETRELDVPPPPELEPLAAVGPDGEVALVARRILRLLREGVEPWRILGAAPTAGYLDRLHAGCAAVGVPVASPRRMDAADVPLVRTLLAVFGALADSVNDTAEQGMVLLGQPHFGLSPAQHDRNHRRLTLAGAGALHSWKDALRLPEGHPARRFAESVEVTAATLAAPQTPEVFATVLSALVLEHGFLASARRSYLDAGRDDAVRSDQQAWSVVRGALVEVGEAFAAAGRGAVTAMEWLAELTAALQGETVRVDHRGVRGVHLTVVGGGLPEADHVFAIGWSEGVFPRRPREEALLPDAVKARLNAAGARLALTADQAAHDEERRERIVRAARRRLVVSWPQVAADGAPQLRSFFAADAGVPSVALELAAAVGETTWPLPLAAGRSEELARAAVLVRHRAEARVGAERQALDGVLAGLDAEEARALRGERHAPQRIVVPAEFVPGIRRAAAAQSASQANRLAQCLYAHFADKRLRIEPLAAPEVGPLERGTVAHRVLAELVLDALGGVARGEMFDPDRTAEIFDRVWAGAVPPALAADPEALFERGVLRERLLKAVRAERALFAACEARPAHAEFGFGLSPDDTDRRDPASLPEGIPLPLPAGSAIPSVVLRGSIDRVDVVEAGGRRFGVALDYKTGKGERYAKNFAQLADFQLPIYSTVLRAVGIEPVGAVFLGIPDGERHGILREDFAERFLPEPGKGVKLLSQEAFERRLQASLEALQGYAAKAAVPEVVVDPRDGDCGFCQLAPLCRVSTFAVVGGGDDDG